MTVLLIDNYDSFVFNLARSVREAGEAPLVLRNNETTVEEINALAPSAIIISPGPGGPSDAGVSCHAIRAFSGRLPILGVCLGHQCIGESFGLAVAPTGMPVHGHPEAIHHCGGALFQGLATPLTAARYHALAVARPPAGHPLAVTAETADGVVMALEHREHPTFGIQFHPESILTEAGDAMVGRFLATRARKAA